MQKQNIILSFEKILSKFTLSTQAAYRFDALEFMNYISAQCKTIDQVINEDIKQYIAWLEKKRIGTSTLTRKKASLKFFLKFLHEFHNIEDFTLYISMKESSQKKDILFDYKTDDIYSLRASLILYLYLNVKVSVDTLAKLQIQNFDYKNFLFIHAHHKIVLPEAFFRVLNKYLTLMQLKSVYLFPVQLGLTIKPISKQALWALIKTIRADKNAQTIPFVKQELDVELLKEYKAKHPRSI